MTPSPADHIVSGAAAGDFQFVDLQFTDVTGSLKSVVLPARHVAETLAYGHWFDGSALEGSARAMETDLLLRPDVSSWAVLPWAEPGGQRTARFLCDIYTPDETPYPADPRAVLRRALADAADLGYEYHVAAEIEFFLFRARSGPAAVPADRSGYFDLSPGSDSHFRDEVVQALAALGVPVEASHHEIGPGQHELDLPLLPALRAADAIVTCKYAVKTVARRRGLAATFMPKPIAGVAGSGLHLAQVLFGASGGNVLGEALDENGLSDTGRSFIAGQLAHARALCAVLAPTVNSYKRLGRGFDAPSSLTWGHSSALAAIRVPRLAAHRVAGLRNGSSEGGGGDGGSGAKHGGAGPHRASAAGMAHVELRCPDPSCNPYLALAASLAAGLDGVKQGLQPPAPSAPRGQGGPLGGMLTGPAEESPSDVLPTSLGEALQELEWDPIVRDALGAPVYERLLLAREQEWQAYRRQVSAWELERYFESA